MAYTQVSDAGRRPGAAIVLLAVALVLVASIGIARAADGWRAIDGDTVVSPAGVVVRIANVDTAEMDCRCREECELARRAKAFTQAALERGQSIELRPYAREQDRHGRTLAYVVVDRKDLGEALMASGLARRWTGRRQPWCVGSP